MGAVLAIAAASCTKSDSLTSSTLKMSLSTGVTAVNNAVSTISTTKGYEILNANSAALKSETTYTDSVTLESVAGIYDYKPDLLSTWNFFIPHKMFVKTGTSAMMIVNLPQKLVFHPRFLRDFNPADTTLANDFSIKASDYYYYFNYTNLYNYRLTAGFTLDTTNLGNMQISATANTTSNSSTSAYTFPNGYSLTTTDALANDTTTKTFNLSKDGTVLMKETTIFAQPVQLPYGMGPGPDFRHREGLYILTIGNVEIRRGAGLDSIQVYLNGVLQQHAGAAITDSSATDGSFCHSRDIKITFDDGTTTNLSALLDPAKTALKTLVDALHSMNFAKNIVDYIAVGIDYNFRMEHGGPH